ncbi:hypothetical protein QUB05_16895 [Microcoleus sp. F10-C6]|uniref:hypothetical protein n=1 Tax=unclassified Microcoleus TaxID=2642155 RepID=UPI002FD3C376
MLLTPIISYPTTVPDKRAIAFGIKCDRFFLLNLIVRPSKYRSLAGAIASIFDDRLQRYYSAFP